MFKSRAKSLPRSTYLGFCLSYCGSSELPVQPIRSLLLVLVAIRQQNLLRSGERMIAGAYASYEGKMPL